MPRLRSQITGLSQAKRVRATLIEMCNGLITVRMGGTGRLLRGLNIIGGGNLVTGQEVFVDYSSGKPIVHAYADTTNERVTNYTKYPKGEDTALNNEDNGIPPYSLCGIEIELPTEADDGKKLTFDFANNKFIWT